MVKLLDRGEPCIVLSSLPHGNDGVTRVEIAKCKGYKRNKNKPRLEEQVVSAGRLLPMDEACIPHDVKEALLAKLNEIYSKTTLVFPGGGTKKGWDTRIEMGCSDTRGLDWIFRWCSKYHKERTSLVGRRLFILLEPSDTVFKVAAYCEYELSATSCNLESYKLAKLVTLNSRKELSDVPFTNVIMQLLDMFYLIILKPDDVGSFCNHYAVLFSEVSPLDCAWFETAYATLKLYGAAGNMSSLSHGKVPFLTVLNNSDHEKRVQQRCFFRGLRCVSKCFTLRKFEECMTTWITSFVIDLPLCISVTK